MYGWDALASTQTEADRNFSIMSKLTCNSRETLVLGEVATSRAFTIITE
jgi:hypothetical protein